MALTTDLGAQGSRQRGLNVPMQPRDRVAPGDGKPATPRPEDHQPNQHLFRVPAGAFQNGNGLLLVDFSLKPIYTSSGASSILLYPSQPDGIAAHATVQERVRTILQTDRVVSETSPRDFLSGRRRYVCRSFLLESSDDRSQAPLVALILERRPRDPLVLSNVARRFHLSRRELETIQYLIHGLRTKEVAQRMSISPNTVKQFVRLIMGKMGVTTRSGIIGTLLRG